MSQNPYQTPDNMAESKPEQSKRKSGWSKGRLITGVLLFFAVVVVGMLLPLTRGGGSTSAAAKRIMCVNNLRQLGLAMLNYESEYGRFPPAYTVAEDGKPLHSWRALILPYIEQQSLFESIDFSKPWDDPVNRKAYETELQVFRCPTSASPKGFTTYLALVTADSCLRPKESCEIADIKDGTSNTVSIVEVPVANAVHWMSPDDADEEMFLQIGKDDSQSSHDAGFYAVRCDGSSRFLRDKTSDEERRALLSVAGEDNDVLDGK